LCVRVCVRVWRTVRVKENESEKEQVNERE